MWRVTDKELQRLESLLSEGEPRIGWANVPMSESILALTIPSGMRSILVERTTGSIVVSGEGEPITTPDEVQFQRANRYERSRFRRHIGDYEDLFTHMYLDTKGLVTVGLGHQIRDVQALMKKTFYTRGTTNKVNESVVMTAYNAVLESGLNNTLATEFMHLPENRIDLDLNEIERLFDKDAEQFLDLLKKNKYFPDFETYPAGAQLGMLDIAYTMGVRGFHTAFGNFRYELGFRNWTVVANESGRLVKMDKNNNPGKMADRNKVVHGWFLEAIRDEPFFLNPYLPHTKLSTVPG